MSAHDYFDEMKALSAFPLSPAERLRAEQFAVWGRQVTHTWTSLLRRLKLLLPAHA